MLSTCGFKSFQSDPGPAVTEIKSDPKNTPVVSPNVKIASARGEISASSGDAKSRVPSDITVWPNRNFKVDGLGVFSVSISMIGMWDGFAGLSREKAYVPSVSATEYSLASQISRAYISFMPNYLMRLLFAIVAISLTFFPSSSTFVAWAQEGATESKSTDGVPWLYKGSDVPIDKSWIFGELKNGLRYAVKKNGVPPRQVSVRVRLDVGSLMERDDEQGFCAFYGTSFLSWIKICSGRRGKTYLATARRYFWK